MAQDGPTQPRVRASSNEWAARSLLSSVIRLLVMIAPTIASFVAVFFIRRRWSPADVGLHVVPYWIGLFAIGFLVLWVVDKAARRFLPLAALFRLSLVFPDEAPNRFAVAMRTGTTRQLERRVKDIQKSGLTPEETRDANTMLELVAALSTHDRLTRGHCERVRAYTDLIAEEMHLHDDDASKLRWAALLHDVGKLFVPFEILNAEGRPTDEEWEILKSHTWKGDELIEPLRDWLGPWANAVRNHHERWDGRGYPDRLIRHEIPLGARIVAVADAYDVMTSKRSYKEPRPAAEARAEIAACAGGQFDPEVARAFLNIGLGRLRLAAGPLSWLANIPGTGGASMAPAGVQVISTGGAAAGAAAVAMASLAAGGVAADVPSEVAFTAPPIEVASETVIAPPTGPVALRTALMSDEDEPVEFFLEADQADGDVVFTIITPPRRGELVLTGVATSEGGSASVPVRYLPGPDVFGRDSFSFQVCGTDGPTRCSQASGTIVIEPVADAPRAVADSANTVEDAGLVVTDDFVLANDIDVDGDALTVRWGPPSVEGVRLTTSGGETSIRPPLNFAGTIEIPYQACDALTCSEPAQLTVSVAAINDAPVALGESFTLAEDATFSESASGFLANDRDVEGDALGIVWLGATPPGTFTPGDPVIYRPPADYVGTVSLSYQVCDRVNCSSPVSAILTFTPVPDPPTVSGILTVPVTEDAVAVVSVVDLLGVIDDPDTGPDGLTFVFEPPAAGTFAADADGFTYAPATDATVPVEIAFEVCDGPTTCATGTIRLTFTPVDDPPTITGTTFTAIEDTTLTVTGTDIEALITDPDTPPADLTITHTNLGTGTLTPDGTGGFTYTPATNATTPVDIEIEVCDTTPNCATATATITITPIDDPPTITGTLAVPGTENSPTVVTNADVLTVVDDVDTPPGSLTFVWTAPATGTFVSDPGGDGFTYTAPLNSTAPVTVSYDVCDAGSCATGAVELTFAAVDSPPVAGDGSFAVQEDTTLSLGRTDVEPLVADPDTAPADLTFSYSDPGTGTFTDDGLGGLQFTPDPDSTTTVTIGYEVCDATSCDTGAITVTIAPVNDAPRITAPPSPLATPYGTPITLVQDYTASDPEGDSFIMKVLVAADGTISTDGTDLVFTPNDGFDGVTTVTFELCDASACASDPVNAIYTITVAANQDPDFPPIADQNVWVGVPLNLGPFPAADPEGAPLTYVETSFPAGLVLTPVPGGFTLTGTITDPSYLGSNHLIHIDAEDPSGASIHQHFDLVFSDQGLSPLAGDVLITEILAQNVVLCFPGFGCFAGEAFELHNPTAAPIDLTGWTVVDHAPGSTGGNSLEFDLVGFINPGEWRAENTAFTSNPTPYNFNADDVWLMDADGLVVDYVAWSDGTPGELFDTIDPELGIWDPAGMAEFAGVYDPATATTISLATLTDANSAACWEFTTSGTAGSGAIQCAAADTFVTYDNPAADNVLFDPAWLHSWGAANYN